MNTERYHREFEGLSSTSASKPDEYLIDYIHADWNLSEMHSSLSVIAEKLVDTTARLLLQQQIKSINSKSRKD